MKAWKATNFLSGKRIKAGNLTLKNTKKIKYNLLFSSSVNRCIDGNIYPQITVTVLNYSNCKNKQIFEFDNLWRKKN